MSKIAIEGFEGKARVGVPTSFVVDATRTAALPVDARLPVGQQQPIVEEIEPRKYRITFNLSGNAGDIVPIEVLYGGEPISNRFVHICPHIAISYFQTLLLTINPSNILFVVH